MRVPTPSPAARLAALARLAVLAAGLTCAAPVAAQRSVAVTGGVESLSAGYADGRSADLTLTLPRAGGWTRLDAGVLDRFGEQTVLVGAAASHNLSDRTVLTGSAGFSASGLIAPRATAALVVGRRLRRDKRVVASAGGAVREARDGHLDLDALGELAVYADGAVVQFGGRVSQSRPGPAWGGGAFVAVTLGDPAARSMTARLAGGREAWTVLAPDQRLDVSFRSWEASAVWREPVGGPWAATLQAGLYANPYYTRLGLRTGVVRRF